MYRFAIEYRNEADERLGVVPIEPDWAPALECARFEAIRQGLVAPSLAPSAVGHAPRVEPVFHGELGPPLLEGVEILVPIDDTAAYREPVANLRAFVRELAREGSSTLVESGELVAGEHYRFHVCAFPIGAANPAGAADASVGAGRSREDTAGFEVEAMEGMLAFAPRPLPAPGRGARRIGEAACDGEMRVVMPPSVLDEVLAASGQANGIEVGGFFVGTMCQDPASEEVFLEITAQLPAHHTDATSASLTFTAETWADAHSLVALRNRDEMLCGWWHHHPHFCHRCPDESRRQCPFRKSFFSATDVHMHRTVFPRPYQVALLASDLGRDDLDVRLYGWRQGAVVERAFDVAERPE